MQLPENRSQVLAKIQRHNPEIGGDFVSWFEVINYLPKKKEWISRANSDTFSSDQDIVVYWTYCKDAF